MDYPKQKEIINHAMYSHQLWWLFFYLRKRGKEKMEKRKIISISNGNQKMGAIPSISMLQGVTCPEGCKCREYCYAADPLFKSRTKTAHERNYEIWKENPQDYFEQINAFCKLSLIPYFRWHVAGDIPDYSYLEGMIKIANENQRISFLCFTKRYEFVNAWMRINGVLPQNLHILFSEDANLQMKNAGHLPVVKIYKDESEIQPDWLLCGGNCTECICRGVGCWQLKNGDTIAIKLHGQAARKRKGINEKEN